MSRKRGSARNGRQASSVAGSGPSTEMKTSRSSWVWAWMEASVSAMNASPRYAGTPRVTVSGPVSGPALAGHRNSASTIRWTRSRANRAAVVSLPVSTVW